MPDLLTHVLAAHVIGRPFRSAYGLVLMYTGTMLPDLLSRPFYILFPYTHEWTIPFHTPVGSILVAWFCSTFMQPDLRRSTFLYLTAGSGLHYLLDTFQMHLGDGNFWLFPFSWKAVEIGLFRPHEVLTILPLLILLAIGIEIVYRKLFHI